MLLSVPQIPCVWLTLVTAYNLLLCKVHLIRGSTRVKASKEEAIALMIAPTTESFRLLFQMIGWFDCHDSSFVNTNYFGSKFSKGFHAFWMIFGWPSSLRKSIGGICLAFQHNNGGAKGWHNSKNTYLKLKFISGLNP